MVTINLTKAAKIITEAAQKPKPKLIISIGKKDSYPDPVVKSIEEKWQQVADNIPNFHQEQLASFKPANESFTSRLQQKANGTLSAQCWDEYNQLRIEQAKEANKIHDLIDGDASKKEIANLYARIEAYRPDLIRLFERARYVDQYGELPAQQEQVNTPTDILALKDQKRKLVDKRCKLQVKIKKGEATNAKKLGEWMMELEIANLEYNQVDDKIKKLEGKL